MLKVDGAKKDWKNISLKECLDGNALDTYFTSKVYCKLLRDVQEKDLEHLYEKLIAPLTTVFRDIEMEGILIDQDRLSQLEVELEGKVDEVQAELLSYPQIKEGINLGSTNDLCRILFSLEKKKTEDGEYDFFLLEDEGFGLFPVNYTKKGSPSTNEESITLLHSMVEKEWVERGLNAN